MSAQADDEHWDVFISHASEDKDSFVRPLAHALREAGLRVWYDEFTLKIGDRLRSSIDRGLLSARFGVVVLSPAFFSKAWPLQELEALFTKESGGGKVVLPIWHGIDEAFLLRESPMLAGRIAARSSEGIAHVAQALVEAIGHGDEVDGAETPRSAARAKTLSTKRGGQAAGGSALLLLAALLAGAALTAFSAATFVFSALGWVEIRAEFPGSRLLIPLLHSLPCTAVFVVMGFVPGASFASVFESRGSDQPWGCLVSFIAALLLVGFFGPAAVDVSLYPLPTGLLEPIDNVRTMAAVYTLIGAGLVFISAGIVFTSARGSR